MKIQPPFDDNIPSINDGINEDDLLNIQNLPLDPDASKVNAKSILKGLLNQITRVDFKTLAEMTEAEKLNNNHLQIITTEQILRIAGENNWNICKNGEHVYVFNGMWWEKVDAEDLKTFFGKGAEKLGVDKFKAKSFNFRDHLYKQFLTLAHLPQKEKSSEAVLINLENGTYEVKFSGGSLNNFDQSDFLTYQLPFKYDQKASAVLFTEFLNKVLPDIDKQLVLAEYLAYIFIRQSALKLEKTLLLYGSGANGKSVFFDIVNALIGSNNMSNFSLQQLTGETGYHRAMIVNKLVNYSSEISSKMETDMFKKLSSGEPVEARSPYGRPYTITQYAKMIFNCNELPKNTENTKAFFRRFLIIHFDVTIPEGEQDKELAKKIISTELSGVFNWVLGGLERLLKQKSFTSSQSASDLLRQYEIESDSVKMFLEENEYQVVPKAQKSFKDLFEEYRIFCVADNFKPVNKKNFKRRLLEYGNGLVIDRINIGYVINLAMKSQENMF